MERSVRKILADITHHSEGKDRYIFILMEMAPSSVRCFECSMYISLWQYPKVKTMLRKVLDPTVTGSNLSAFVSCLISQINQVEGIREFFWGETMLDKDTGKIKFEKIIPYEQLQPDPVPAVMKFEPAKEASPFPKIQELELDYQRMRYGPPLYTLLRFDCHPVPILTNRSLFKAKAFIIRSRVDNEIIKVYAFFDGNDRIIRIKYHRHKFFDKEMAFYLFSGFVENYLKRLYVFALKECKSEL